MKCDDDIDGVKSHENNTQLVFIFIYISAKCYEADVDESAGTKLLNNCVQSENNTLYYTRNVSNQTMWSSVNEVRQKWECYIKKSSYFFFLVQRDIYCKNY